MEFQALKMLINNINTKIEFMAKMNRLKAALQLYKLHPMILQDASAQTGVPETMPANSGSAARLRHSSLFEDCADNLAMLLMETTAYKAAVQTIQKNYFESHLMLYKDIEMAFEMTIQTIRDAIAAFNEYRKVMANLSNQKSDQEQQKAGIATVMAGGREGNLSIDIEAIERCANLLRNMICNEWLKSAKIIGTAAILKETGKHEDFIWQHFRKEIGLNFP
jgi:hypothetical protein